MSEKDLESPRKDKKFIWIFTALYLIGIPIVFGTIWYFSQGVEDINFSRTDPFSGFRTQKYSFAGLLVFGWSALLLITANLQFFLREGKGYLFLFVPVFYLAGYYLNYFWITQPLLEALDDIFVTGNPEMDGIFQRFMKGSQNISRIQPVVFSILVIGGNWALGRYFRKEGINPLKGLKM